MRSMVYETVERSIDSSNGHLSSFARPFNVGLAVLRVFDLHQNLFRLLDVVVNYPVDLLGIGPGKIKLIL